MSLKDCQIDPQCEMGWLIWSLSAGAVALDLVLIVLQPVIRTTSLHPMHIMHTMHPGKHHDALSSVGLVGQALLVHPCFGVQTCTKGIGASAVSWCKGRFPRARGPDVRACGGWGSLAGLRVVGGYQWRTHQAGHQDSGHR